jgi:glutamate-1-semialdehyde 2,1-aminomutase
VTETAAAADPAVAGLAFIVGNNERMRAVVEQVLARQRGSVERHARARGSLSATHSMLAFEAPLLPICVTRAQGGRVVDVDGNEYVDCHMSYSSTILGHNPEPVVAAVREALPRGLQGGHFFEEQIELAELVKAMVPGAERVSLFHTGGEAIASAVRLARTATARPRIAKFEGLYHGSNDVGLHNTWSLLSGRIAHDPPDAIAPEVATSGMYTDDRFLILPFNSPVALDLVRRNADDLACIVVDPIPPFMSNWPEDSARFVRELAACAKDADVPLVFDEVVCGFRLAPGGAREAFGVVPQMSCYGKITSGLGIALAPMAGEAAFMDAARTAGPFRDYFSGKVWVSSTLSGNFLAVIASLAVLRHLSRDYAAVMGRVDRNHALLRERLDDFARRSGIPASVQGHPRLQAQLAVGKAEPAERTYRGVMKTTSPAMVRMLLALTFYLRLNGVYTKTVPSMNLSAGHTEEDVDRIAAAVERSLLQMREDGMLMPV